MAVDGFIRLDGVSKHYGLVKAVDNVSLNIPFREITVILGPSGSGKTTLLRIIAGLEKPDHGRIFFGKHDVTGKPPWERSVSMVFQEPALLPHLNAFENIAFGLEAHGLARDVVRERVLWASKLLHIESLLDKYPDQLSGGEQQRVALARALVVKPKILLLDEPLSNLDLSLREELRIELKRIQRETGITFIHVTHDQDEALELADYLVVLYNGRVVDYGEPLRVYEKPRSILAARVFGHNIVDAIECKEETVYPWMSSWRSCKGRFIKAIIPQHRIVIEKTSNAPCTIRDLVYRRNYGLAIIDCNGVLLKVSINLREMTMYSVGDKVKPIIDSKTIIR